MQGRLTVVLAFAALAAGACEEAKGNVEPLPPLQRPSPEQRAGLPEVRGVWRFAGFEIRAQDTMLVREQAYQLTPPDEIRIITQRLDSIAGQIVRGGVGFPFSGEVRRDSALSFVTFSEGIGSFAAGHVRRDTFWIELTTLPVAAGWPPQARAALVRRVGGPPFRRLLGGAPIAPPVDSAAIRDSIRMDSLRRAGVPVTPAQPGVQVPAAGQPPVTVPAQPGARPTVPGQQLPQAQPQRPPAQTQPQQRPQTQPQQRPPAQRPPAQTQPRPQPQRPPVTEPQRPPVAEPEPEPQPPAQTPPNPNAPRDTIRFGAPPPAR